MGSRIRPSASWPAIPARLESRTRRKRSATSSRTSGRSPSSRSMGTLTPAAPTTAPAASRTGAIRTWKERPAHSLRASATSPPSARSKATRKGWLAGSPNTSAGSRPVNSSAETRRRAIPAPATCVMRRSRSTAQSVTSTGPSSASGSAGPGGSSRVCVAKGRDSRMVDPSPAADAITVAVLGARVQTLPRRKISPDPASPVVVKPRNRRGPLGVTVAGRRGHEKTPGALELSSRSRCSPPCPRRPPRGPRAP